MTKMNPSGPGATVSASGVPDELVTEFDNWWQDGDFDSRSEAIRHAMSEVLSDPASTSLPLVPPTDPVLDHGYRRLVASVNRDGIIIDGRARKACTNGPRNLSKEEVSPVVLRPLQRRGYLKRLTNALGHTSWKLSGWDR